MRSATILDLGANELIPLSEIGEGDEVRIFGLAACEGDEIQFHGFVILVGSQAGDGDV